MAHWICFTLKTAPPDTSFRSTASFWYQGNQPEIMCLLSLTTKRNKRGSCFIAMSCPGSWQYYKQSSSSKTNCSGLLQCHIHLSQKVDLICIDITYLTPIPERRAATCENLANLGWISTLVSARIKIIVFFIKFCWCWWNCVITLLSEHSIIILTNHFLIVWSKTQTITNNNCIPSPHEKNLWNQISGLRKLAKCSGLTTGSSLERETVSTITSSCEWLITVWQKHGTACFSYCCWFFLMAHYICFTLKQWDNHARISQKFVVMGKCSKLTHSKTIVVDLSFLCQINLLH